MYRKRITIGFPLDAATQKMLAKNIKQWADLPVTWHAQESFFVALLDLGWLDDDMLTDVTLRLHQTVQELTGPTLAFNEISAQLNKDESAPRRVRLVGSESEELTNLVNDLHSILELPGEHAKSFRPFVSLGKVRQKAWRKTDGLEVPQKECVFTYDALMLGLFEAIPEGEKTIFTPIEIFELK